MKVTELMVGDWVVFNATFCEIEEISKHGWIHLTNSHGMRLSATSDYSLSLIEPIPITAEILEKNGFERCPTCHNYWLGADTYTGVLFGISEDSYEDTWHVMDFQDHNDNNWVLFKICYVHELQHILRLLNIDKEIEI